MTGQLAHSPAKHAAAANSACPVLLQALALEANDGQHTPYSDEHGSGHGDVEVCPFNEITVASADQPKLLSRLSEALVSAAQRCSCFALCMVCATALRARSCWSQGNLGLSIREAHAFNTVDNFSLASDAAAPMRLCAVAACMPEPG